MNRVNGSLQFVVFLVTLQQIDKILIIQDYSL